jgi:hypothetical protein
MADYVLIKDGIVQNIIVADESFIEFIKKDYDAILDHDSFPEVAHVGGQAAQVDGKWVFGVTPMVYGTVAYVDAEVVSPAIEAPVVEEE